jgi:hypothetical protein
MTDDLEVEPAYGVASHLDQGGTIGFIPTRTFYLVLAGLVLGSLPAYITFSVFQVKDSHQPILHVVLAAMVLLIPVLILSPFAMWWLDPPAEHGMMRMFHYRLHRKLLHSQDLASLRDVTVQDGVIHTPDGVRAILVLPTVNLDLASVASKRRHRNKLKFIDGLSTHPFQIVIRTHTQSTCTAIERMKLHRNPVAKQLAQWLTTHYDTKQAIDRSRYLILPAPDADTLRDRIETVSRSLAQSSLEPELLTEDADIKAVLNDWWTWRPHPERLGPELVRRDSKGLQIDGECARVYAFKAMPSSIVTNWWASICDGDLNVDVSITYQQKDLGTAKWNLEMRYNNLAASRFSPGRGIALQQIQQLRTAFETRVRPWDTQILFTVRGHDPASRDRYARRLEQQIKDLGGKLALLRWEQLEGMQSAQPLCSPMLVHRPLYLESGTLARSTPFSASFLRMLDGVPWGLSGAVPILLTSAHMRTGKHFGWFGYTGSGKGFGLRCYLARRHFADRLRIFMWDADSATHEYAGRFTQFLGGVGLVVNRPEDMDRIELDPTWQVVALDVSGLPIEYQPGVFERWKLLVEQHVLAFPAETAFVVDEAMSLAEHPDSSGARALGDAVQRWRKYGIECHVVTQRVSDWFGTSVGRKIQGNLAVKWYGAQEDSELFDIAKHVRWSPEETERVAGAGIGQGLLVAFGRRVWADLYEQIAPFEYEAYSTDPPEKVETLARPSERTPVLLSSGSGNGYVGERGR